MGNMKIFALAAFAILIAGCAGAPREATGLVVVSPTWVGYGPLYIAQEKGFFAQRGIDVKILEIEGQSEVRAMLAGGNADIVLHTVDMGIVDVGAGSEQRFVYMLDESLGADGVISKQSIATLKGLEGKKVACQIGVPAYFFLRSLMEKQGIEKNSVQFLDIPADEAGAAFFNGDVDAACTWEPWLSKAAASSGGKILVSSADVPGKIVDVVAPTPAALQNKRPAIKAFIEAWIDAQQYIATNPGESYRIMSAHYSMTPEEFREISATLRWNSLQEAKAFFDGPIYSLAEEINQIAVQDGMISAPVDVNALIDQSIVRELGK